LGCQYQDLSCFRRATFQDIIDAQTVVNTMLTSLDFLVFFEPWVPVIDNSIVHGQLYDTVKNLSFPLKPLMIGTVSEDALFFIYTGWKKPVTPVQFVEAAIASFGTNALKILERYPPIESDDQRPLLTRIGTPWVFSCTNRIIARQTTAYSYVFAYPLDFDGWENSTFCNGHVCHGGDLPYLFESFWSNFTDSGRLLSSSMATYWSNFGKSMNPNLPVPLPIAWPKMSTEVEPYILFQNPIEIRTDYLKDDCDFFDKIGYKLNRPLN
jgi:carboxylesterase type B